MTQTLNTTDEYMKDIPFTVNGVPFIGVGVAALAPSYAIRFNYPFGKMDVLTLQTCARNIKLENLGGKASYLFVPSRLEREEECELEIGIFNAKGEDGWGLLQLERANANLVAMLECNGETITAKGVSLCQSKKGTLQRISFSVPVTVESDPGCTLLFNKGGFEYEVPSGFCYFTFQDANGNYHEHTVYGYTNFIIRGE